MSEWLRSLPHQIPFRSASEAVLVDEASARGTRLVTAGDALPGAPPELMLVEAMAQVAGIVAFRGSGRPGTLAGIEQFRIERLPAEGDAVTIEVELTTQFGGIFRFDGRAAIDDELIATGRFYLSGGEQS